MSETPQNNNNNLKKDGSSCASYSSFLPESKDIIVKLIGEFKLGVGVNGSVSLY